MIVWVLVCVVVAKFLWWIVAALLVGALVHILREMLVAAVAHRELAWQRQAVIGARADRQHAAVLAGDELVGVYGDYPPAV
jgi:hypothetical protein